jgi:hypothetical protein
MTDDLALDEPTIWTNPDAEKDQPTLVRLTPAALVLATIPPDDLEHVIAELTEGGDVPGQVIPFSSLSRVGGDEDSRELTVTFWIGPSKTESRPIAFADKAQRDEFLDTLVGALGPDWRRLQKPMSRGKAGFWTLGPTLLVALATWGLHAEAARIAQGNPPVNWGPKGKLKLLATVAHWVEQQLGPTGVLIVGGILVGVGLILFALVMASPPMTLVVEPVEPS